MKRTLRIVLTLTLVLSVLTTGFAMAKYATTASSSFNLDIKAARYTLTFNANGGTFASGQQSITKTNIGTSIFEIISDKPSRAWHDFMGWSGDYTATTGTIFGSVDATTINTLYAAWDPQIKTNNDTTGGNTFTDPVYGDDGSLTFDLTPISGHERMVIPLGTLNSRYKYSVTFDFSGTVTLNDYNDGHNVYKVIDYTQLAAYKGDAQSSELSTNELAGSKQFPIDIDGKGVNSHKWSGIYNGEYYFTPTTNPMYLFLEFSDTFDKNKYENLKISNIQLHCLGVDPIDNLNGSSDVVYSYTLDRNGYTFYFTGGGWYERVGIPIQSVISNGIPGSDLVVGQQYTVTFNFTANSEPDLYSVRDNLALGDQNSHRYYAYQVSTSVNNKFSGTTTDSHKYKDNNWKELRGNQYQTLSFTFIAESEQQYLWFDFSDVVDGNAYVFNVNNLSVQPTPTY